MKCKQKVSQLKESRNNFAFTASVAANSSSAQIVAKICMTQCFKNMSQTLIKPSKSLQFQKKNKRERNNFLTVSSSFKTLTSCLALNCKILPKTNTRELKICLINDSLYTFQT